MTTRTFTLTARGAFSLRESATFGFGQRMRPAGVGEREARFDGSMRLAFCLDGTYTPVGVVLRQDGPDVHAEVHGPGPLPAVRAQVARVLSLDHDATGYDALGSADPVVGRLQAAAPGLRPPLFHSAYEAALWAVLSARRPGWQMDRVRAELARIHGAVFELAGEQVGAVPGPRELLGVDSFPGIDPQRLARLHGVARAAADGLLDTARLRSLHPDDALRDVQRISGIGPFYASLIVIRALGHTDVLPTGEHHALDVAGRLYRLGGQPTPQQFAAIADAWRPWRTWVTVLMRAAAHRVLDTAA